MTQPESGAVNEKCSLGPLFTIRYDHLSVLCELIPVALPSLAACLQTLLQGQFNAEAQSKVTEQLGISSVEVDAMER